MKILYKRLGRTKERIPALGMGTWQMDVNGEALSALKKGLQLGDRFIDTAEIYGTEELVGSAIKGETDVFIASKVWPSHFKYDDVINACEQSLRRLGVKTIDLYQLHWPNYTVPIEETMAAMERLQKEGKIRHIGVSNFTARELQEAQACLSHSDIVSNQIEYSVIMREFGDEMLDFCKREKITIIAYSPLGTGALFERERVPLLRLMEEMGDRNKRSAAQVALNWLIEKEPVVAIPKASTPEHAAENIGAMGFRLSEDEASQIDNMSRKFQKKPLAGRHIRKIMKHTRFWHKYAEKKYGGKKQ